MLGEILFCFQSLISSPEEVHEFLGQMSRLKIFSQEIPVIKPYSQSNLELQSVAPIKLVTVI